MPSLSLAATAAQLTCRIQYPEDFPIHAHCTEISRVIQKHQVVILSGETGSGKTTQLPKICLALGRGRRQIIGHTQPRRLAAISVAHRIAQELDTTVGEGIGYQVRFNDRVGPNTVIKLMTDGILLAETQRDPLLKRYDTLIIDEAHERSLNIDFLLGYLKQLLPKRPNLKVIITSATIDAERFAQHFAATPEQPAPIITISGRLYPVEIRWRPVQPHHLPPAESKHATLQGVKSERSRDEEGGLLDTLIAATEECMQHGQGDILVFLPGEREIRDTAEALHRQAWIGTEILALYARLSQADQARIFQPHHNLRRIILTTNVAETSLTVPGIRFVIDTGLARIKRYSWRNKVEQLRIEAISRASANQRTGRCGRIGPGICIRLYDEIDFNARPPFTIPEILRCSLASVILRMKSLKLGDIEDFPFLERPSSRAIADGYHLLQELGALEASPLEQHQTPPSSAAATTLQTEQAPATSSLLAMDNDRPSTAWTLTALGDELANLPVDPRIGRMILAARDQHCLAEMLIIAAALSVQDPRDRPLHEKAAAENAHTKFTDHKSEFLSFIKLWHWYHRQETLTHSKRKRDTLLRQHFLSPLRLREWHNVHQQLAHVVHEKNWRLNQSDATFEQIHTALLTGLLGNIGIKSNEGNHYQGTRDIRFYIHPGSTLIKKGNRCIVAAELIETTRLYARCVALIELSWVERVAAHLLRRAWSEPRWEKKSRQVVAKERATLYGLTIYTGRRVHYGRINPKHAREIFIREALVGDDIDTCLPFFIHNRQLIAEIKKLEQQTRRPDILVDDALIYAFYDRQIPDDMSQAVSLETWHASLDEPAKQALMLTREALMQHDAAGITTEIFPKHVEWQGVKMAVDYHFEPGSHRDGMTLSVPLFALNQLDAQRCEWLVPGMLKEKVHLLLKSLPQKIRRHCVPLPDYAAAFYDRWFDRLHDPQQSLLEALATDIGEHIKLRPVRTDFKIETLAPHLFMNFRVLDEHQRVLTTSRNLMQLKAEYGQKAQTNFQQLAARDSQVAQTLEQKNLTSWSFGPLPEYIEINREGQTIVGYPALVDRGLHCDLEIFDNPQEARWTHNIGLLRLFRLALREQLKFLEKNLPALTRISLLFMPLGTQEALRDQIIDCAVTQACLREPLPTDAKTFELRRLEGKSRLGLLAQEITHQTDAILTEWAALQRKLAQAQNHRAAYADLQQQIGTLIHGTFLRQTPAAHLSHFPRYLKAAAMRIDKLRADPLRDQRLMAEMAPLLTQYQRTRTALKGKSDPQLDEFRWLLEELRVALFAQTLRTPMPISVKRLQKTWEARSR
jgi:ATP-dependent helicase HrpA